MAVLTDDLKKQIESLMPLLKRDVVLSASLGDDERSGKMRELLTSVAGMSEKISFDEHTDAHTPSFLVTSPGTGISIRFAGLPLGHEFASFMLALVQAGGHPPKVDDATRQAIEGIDRELEFVTYMSLSCQNCPEVVQSLNIMAVLNPKIRHTAIEGGAFQDEVDAKGIKSVPSVWLNGEEFGSGRMGVADIVGKIDSGAAAKSAARFKDQDPFDVLVAGAGPAGVAAAVYAARKGLRVGMVGERVGGQVLDTAAIENLIALPHTEGPNLGDSLRQSAEQAGVIVMEPLEIISMSDKDADGHISLTCAADVVLTTRTLVLATGAAYRSLGVPGEEEYRTRGVTFCPHCDGPLFKGQDVAVIGGGNSGVEAAIDLAGITGKVSVVEFLPECRADKVLMDAAAKTGNIDFFTNSAVKEIAGDGKEVTGIVYTDRETGEDKTIDVKGVFVQIGLIPRTDWLKNSPVELTDRGEVTIDGRGATNVEGVFAAGDCATTPYKQIVTAIGSGATAALSAYEYIALGR